jgi:hypothetical protein
MYSDEEIIAAAEKQFMGRAKRANDDYKRLCKTHKIGEFIKPWDFLTTTTIIRSVDYDR